MRRISRLFGGGSAAHGREAKADETNAVEALRADIAALESELAEQRRQLEVARANAVVFEQQAMDAIRVGDDRAARDALVRQRAVFDTVGALEADVQVLGEALGEMARLIRLSRQGAVAGRSEALEVASESDRAASSRKE